MDAKYLRNLTAKGLAEVDQERKVLKELLDAIDPFARMAMLQLLEAKLQQAAKDKNYVECILYRCAAVVYMEITAQQAEERIERKQADPKGETGK